MCVCVDVCVCVCMHGYIYTYIHTSSATRFATRIAATRLTNGDEHACGQKSNPIYVYKYI